MVKQKLFKVCATSNIYVVAKSPEAARKVAERENWYNDNLGVPVLCKTREDIDNGWLASTPRGAAGGVTCADLVPAPKATKKKAASKPKAAKKKPAAKTKTTKSPAGWDNW